MLALAPIALALVAIGRERPDRARVYTLAAVLAGLECNPGAWVGRTVWLRAIADPCQMWGSPAPGVHCVDAQPVLVDQVEAPVDSLRLTWRRQGALPALLRRLPLAGPLVPPPQAVRWGAVATYRVRLRAAPAGSCPYPPCYQALLLDPAQ